MSIGTHVRPTIGTTPNAPLSSTDPQHALGRPRKVFALVETLDPMTVSLQRMIKVGEAVRNPKIEWTDEKYGATAATVDATGATAVATSLTLAAGHGNRIQLFDVLQTPAGENVIVTATAGDTLTLTRGFGGTTAAAIGAAAVLEILGPAAPEKVDSPASPVVYGSFYNNYIQNFLYAIEVSDIQDNTDTAYLLGVGKQYKREMAKKMKEAFRDYERTLIRGRKNDQTVGNSYAMGGFLSYITVNVATKSGAAVGWGDFMALAQATWDDVGEEMGMTVVLNAFLKRVFSSLVNGKRSVNDTLTAIKVKLTEVETDLGTFDFLVHRHMPKDTLACVDLANFVQHPYNGLTWQEEQFARTRASKSGHIEGVYTGRFMGDRAHFKITGASTTVADYAALSALI